VDQEKLSQMMEHIAISAQNSKEHKIKILFVLLMAAEQMSIFSLMEHAEDAS